MANEFLKDVLSEETYSKVCEELEGKETKLADLSKGDYISKAKYNALESQLNNANALLQTKTEEYETLKSKAGDNEALKAEIESLKTDFEAEKANLKADFDKSIKKSTIENAIITGYKPHDVKDVMSYVDMDKITVDDNGITGLKDQVESLKETKAYLFETEAENKPAAGGLTHAGGDNLDTKALFAAFGIKNQKE